jgi:hypothetical protein
VLYTGIVSVIEKQDSFRFSSDIHQLQTKTLNGGLVFSPGILWRASLGIWFSVQTTLRFVF